MDEFCNKSDASESKDEREREIKMPREEKVVKRGERSRASTVFAGRDAHDGTIGCAAFSGIGIVLRLVLGLLLV